MQLYRNFMRFCLLFVFILLMPVQVYSAVMQQAEKVEEPDNADNVSENNADNQLFERPKNNIPHSPVINQNDIDKEIQIEVEQKDLEPPPVKTENAMESGYNLAILQGLNKVTARATKIEVEVGSHARFGTLEVSIRSCWKSTPNEKEENAKFLNQKPKSHRKEYFLVGCFLQAQLYQHLNTLFMTSHL